MHTLGINSVSEFQHHIPAFLVDFANMLDVAIDETMLPHFMGKDLVKGGRI